MKKFVLYVGLNDKDTKLQQISTLEAYKVACNVCRVHLSGFTIIEATGFYTHENGDIVTETSLKIEVSMTDDETITKVVEMLKVAFNQESIVQETVLVESKLV